MSQRALINVLLLICLNIELLTAQVPTLDPAKTVVPATGEMGFTLPLGIISTPGDRLQFPVALTYQAGILVEQEASPAGLGFAVSAGGIWRKTVMIDDNTVSYYEEQHPNCEAQLWFKIVTFGFAVLIFIGTFALSFIPGIHPVGIAMLQSILPILTNGINQGILSMITIGPQSYVAGGTHLPDYSWKHIPDEQQGRGYFNGGSKYDYPDVYHLSTPYINGEIVPVGDPSSGRFVLKNGSGSVNGESAIKIKYTPDTEEFVVTLLNGTKLFFGGEYCDLTSTVTRNKGSRNEDNFFCNYSNTIFSGVPHASFWHLRKIVLPGFSEDEDDGQITFNYMKIEDELIQGGAIRYQTSSESSSRIYRRSERMCFLSSVESGAQRAVLNYIQDRKDNVWFSLERTGDIVHKIGPECGLSVVTEQVCDDYDNCTSEVKSREEMDVPIWKVNHVNFPRLESVDFFNDGVSIQRSVVFETDYILRPNSPGGYIYLFENPVLEECYGVKCDKFKILDDVKFPDGYNGEVLTLKSITFKSDHNELPPIVFNYDLLHKNPSLRRPLCRLPDGAKEIRLGEDEWHYEYYNVIEKDIWGYYYNDGIDENELENSKNEFNTDGDHEKTVEADAWSLKSVQFPNGLNISWDYESNRYDTVNNVLVKFDGNPTKYGGGIRVRKVTFSDGVTQDPQTIDYHYRDVENDFNSTLGSSSGFCTVELGY